ncbi:glycosyltransferase [Rhodopirellula maiorica SM1]|uniref:Glycosyltransferase n=1 Tax=Rhodopirellula maiorica SM1 TaxID=1265738 RepID=M5RR76_9BACT|nr:glycosyltransferase [Rhodopirellula maiorica SM1]
MGGVILNELKQSVPSDSLKFIPIPSRQVIDLSWLDHATDLAGHVVRKYETGWRPVKGIAGEALGWLARKALFERHCTQLTQQICATDAAKHCDKIWAILDCPTVIQIATGVAKRLNKPLSILVWDAPELLVNSLNMDRWSASNMLYRFSKTIQHAESVGVICEQMQTAYMNQFGPKPYVILRLGIRRDMWYSPGPLPNSNRIIIGFAGSITAQQPFRQLIKMLDETNWRIHNKDVTLRLIGSRYTLDARQPQRIEYFGWCSLSETVRLLAECHMLYLPQPFEANLRPLAELSFPTKLTTYVAAGRPVLLHAPRYASVTPFLNDYPLGLACHSLETDSLRRCAEQLDRLPNESVAAAIDAVRHTEFNDSVFVKRFNQLIGAASNASGLTSAATKEIEQNA